MSHWRAEAIRRFPEMRKRIEQLSSITALWIELTGPFLDAYAKQRDESLILRVYQFADYCMRLPRVADAGFDPVTAVCITFFEFLPNHKETREDMPRWLTYEEVRGSEEIFKYLIGDESYLELLEFMQQNRHRFQNGWRYRRVET